MNIFNNLIANVASLFLPDPLDKAAKFHKDNESRLDGYVSDGKKLLKVVSTESQLFGGQSHLSICSLHLSFCCLI
jgi:hypothetical protein